VHSDLQKTLSDLGSDSRAIAADIEEARVQISRDIEEINADIERMRARRAAHRSKQ
jgi:hypothetical protein